MYQEISRLLVTVASIVVTFGFYHQAIKIWRTRSVDDFTATVVLALFINELTWLNYGCSIMEWPIIVVTCSNLPAATMVAVGYYRYRSKKCLKSKR